MEQQSWDYYGDQGQRGYWGHATDRCDMQAVDIVQGWNNFLAGYNAEARVTTLQETK